MNTIALILSTCMLSVATAAAAAADEPKPARYLYAWAGDDDEKDSDFLAVIDVDPKSGTYGKVVAT